MCMRSRAEFFCPARSNETGGEARTAFTGVVGTLRALAVSGVVAALTFLPTAWAEKYASIVVDANTMTVLHARNAEEPRFPASLTKVMTLYMVFDALKAGQLRLGERITMSANAASMQPSKLGLAAGGTLTVEQAIEALITKSANDVAVAVAERLGGTESRFAALMTVKARALGLTNTRFRNASGLPDPNQVTTALDLARLADSIMIEHADYYDFFSIGQMDWNGSVIRNHNRLLGWVDGVDGIKTGYTRASGFNLMTAAERHGQRVIAIVLGGATAKARDDHMADLVRAAFVAIEDKRSTIFEGVDATYAQVDAQLAFQSLPNPALEPDNTTDTGPGFEEGSLER